MVLGRLFGRGKGKETAAEGKAETEQQVDAPETQEPSRGLLGRLRQGLAKTRQTFVSRVEGALQRGHIDETLYEELEEALLEADVGVDTTMELMDNVRSRVKADPIREAEALREVLQEEMQRLFPDKPAESLTDSEAPAVIMVVGVNGSGKTTTIAKLAARLKGEGYKVLLGAGDTFRAAAIDQLQTWANRLAVDIVAQREGSDPAAVAYDALAAARARKADVVILDTAGRLQTKKNLMAELSKVHRVLTRELGRAVDEVLLVIDATTGQNALSQGKLFQEAVPLTGIVLSKLDGTAKGGAVLALGKELQLPVKLVGTGERLEDLDDFEAETFVKALFSRDAQDDQ